MASLEQQDAVWNKYIDRSGNEPTDASKLLHFSKNKTNDCLNLNFATSRKVFNRNKGKGKINSTSIWSSSTNPSSQSLSIEEKYKVLEAQYKSLKEERDELSETVKSLTKDKNDKSSTTKDNKKREIWDQIYDKLISDPDSIKLIIKRKLIDINEKDTFGQTILMLAADYGHYELAQFAINSGSDINIKDEQGRTALDWARKAGYYNIEQLLLFAEMNVNIEMKSNIYP